MARAVHGAGVVWREGRRGWRQLVITWQAVLAVEDIKCLSKARPQLGPTFAITNIPLVQQEGEGLCDTGQSLVHVGYLRILHQIMITRMIFYEPHSQKRALCTNITSSTWTAILFPKNPNLNHKKLFLYEIWIVFNHSIIAHLWKPFVRVLQVARLIWCIFRDERKRICLYVYLKILFESKATGPHV